jgi:hypothetical protein
MVEVIGVDFAGWDRLRGFMSCIWVWNGNVLPVLVAVI